MRPSRCWLQNSTRSGRSSSPPNANAPSASVIAVRSRGRVEPVFVEKIEQLAEALAGVLRAGDVVVTMGAGSIGAVAHELPARLAGGAA